MAEMSKTDFIECLRHLTEALEHLNSGSAYAGSPALEAMALQAKYQTGFVARHAPDPYQIHSAGTTLAGIFVGRAGPSPETHSDVSKYEIWTAADEVDEFPSLSTNGTFTYGEFFQGNMGYVPGLRELYYWMSQLRTNGGARDTEYNLFDCYFDYVYLSEIKGPTYYFNKDDALSTCQILRVIA